MLHTRVMQVRDECIGISSARQRIARTGNNRRGPKSLPELMLYGADVTLALALRLDAARSRELNDLSDGNARRQQR